LTAQRPRLRRSKQQARQQILARNAIGRHILDSPIGGRADVSAMEDQVRLWSDGNQALFADLFASREPAEDYVASRRPLEQRFAATVSDRAAAVARALILGNVALEDHLQVLDVGPESQYEHRVFIGHGRSPDWRELKEFIEVRLRLPTDEFNRTPVAGRQNTDRLEEMLDNAALALLVLTAEDERSDGGRQARQNVVHEAGLFQGRLGWQKAIVVLEEGCEIFSNIAGLGYLAYPSTRIRAAFEDIRLVAEREGLIAN
jgi:predicted nucleotide-binding protein